MDLNELCKYRQCAEKDEEPGCSYKDAKCGGKQKLAYHLAATNRKPLLVVVAGCK